MLYYCQSDGGQWNVKVDLVEPMRGTGLYVVRAVESGTLTGLLGSDGHIYAIVPRTDLWNEPQGARNG